MRKSKIAFFVVSAVVLVAVIVTLAVAIFASLSRPAVPASSFRDLSVTAKNIRAFCRPTDYNATCVSALTAAAGNRSAGPQELVDLALEIAIDRVDAALNLSAELANAAEDEPRQAEALLNCRELLDYAADDLRASLGRIHELSLGKLDKLLDDLKVWLSAAVTDQETCLDGFEGSADGEAAESMRAALAVSYEHISNMLAILDRFKEIIADIDLPSGRKLLDEEESPRAWVVESGKRRLLQLSPAELKPDITVAKDRSGNVTTVTAAVRLIPEKSKHIFVVYIKEGVYKENVHVDKTFTNVMMVGDGPTKTKITGNLNYADGTPTFKTATFAVIGDGFIGKDLWIENSAGPEKHQAVALRVQSDKSVFYNCRFDGYQDTLYVHAKRQFYRECTISGTIDFIFGDAASVFQNCLILARKPLDNQQNIVTAQGRKERHEATGIVLHNCTVAADRDFLPHRRRIPTYLGRPWKEHSRTVVLQSRLDDLIADEGWMPWDGEFALRTCFYAEVDNRGPGAGKSGRAKWRGVKNVEFGRARRFAVGRFIEGSTWLPKTGVPYVAGLLPEGSID